MSSPVDLVEFPGDDSARARRFWTGLLGIHLAERHPSEGVGWQTRSGQTELGVHPRGPGPGDTVSIPYLSVPDLAQALARVPELGGTVIHPGERWAICKDSEGSPFGLTERPSSSDATGSVERSMGAAEVRRLIEEHFAAASHDQIKTQEIYADDAVLEFPQGGERIRGKANITAFRSAYPAKLDFEMRRTTGRGDIWVNEYVIRYDGKPVNVVGIMEFRDGKVFRETIYFGEPWDPPEWRAQWVEPLT